MRIAFFVWEYPPAIVGGLGTYAQYITKEFITLGWDVCVYTLNPGNLKTREVLNGVEVHRPIIVDAGNVFPLFVAEDLRKWGANIKFFNDMICLTSALRISLSKDIEWRNEHVIWNKRSISERF